MKKRIFSLLMAICLIALMISTQVFALEDVGTTATGELTVIEAVDSDGDGYVEIDTAEKLWWFTQQVNNGNRSLNAELTANIDLSGTCGDGIGNWLPIGNKYSGHFNGQGFTISNLYMTGNEQYAGLFGYVKGATIENVTVTGSVSSTFYWTYDPDTYEIFNGAVGGVVAHLDGGTIRACESDVTVTGGLEFGGICGRLSSGIIEDCINRGTIIRDLDSTDVVHYGGIVGYMDGGTIRGCINQGADIVGTHAEIGGIAGQVAEGTVENCINLGNITTTQNTSAGGIAGRIWIYGAIRNCGNYGIVTGEDVGGITGINEGIIEHSWNIASVSGTSENVGPIAGLVYGENGTSTNNYYLSDTTTEDGGRTAEQFASGQVAYELNGSTTTDASVWRQTLGTDTYPTLTGELVYCNTTQKCDGTILDSQYSNSSGNIVIHDLTYTASGNVITETCANPTCSHSATATIGMEDTCPYYNGTAHYVPVTYSDGWAGGELVVSYSGTAYDGSDYAVTGPVSVGGVDASISIGSATAEFGYSIQPSYVDVGTVFVESPTTVYNTIDIADVILGRTNAVVEGTLTLTERQYLSSGRTEYEWTFTPDDLVNYLVTGGYVSITVVEDSMQGIEITTAPTKTEYTYGDTFDKTGMVVTATYASGRTVDVTDRVTIESGMLTVATTSVSVSYEGFTDTQAVTVNPMVINNYNFALTTSHWEYTGEPVTVTFTVYGYGSEELPASEYTVTYTNNIAIGEATITLTDNPGGNYEVNASLTFNIVEAVLKEVSVSQNGTLTYTGEAQTPTVSANATTVDGATVNFTYCLEQNGTYVAELPTFTNAGTYTVYFKANAANHVESSGSFEIVVGKATNEWTTEPSITGWTYGELGNDPTAKAKFGDEIMFAYRAVGATDWWENPPTEAGSYEMRARVQATDNWVLLETIVPYTIAKADPTADIFDFAPPANLDVCDGSAKEATVTVKEGIEGVGSITVKYFKDGEPLDGAPATVGTYTVKIEVAEGANFFAADDLTVGTFTFDITDETDHANVTITSNGNGTHDKFCTVCEKVLADDAACVFLETVDDAYLVSPATCVSGATYYKSCNCGHVSDEAFAVGALDPDNHTGTDDKLVSDNAGKHNVVWSCCNAVISENVACTPIDADDTCLTAETCICGYVIQAAAAEHDFSGDYLHDADGHWHKCKNCSVTDAKEEHSGIDDGSCLTAVICYCETVVIEAKDDHGFDNACDTDCNNPGCEYTRITYHEPLPDDGNCTTPIRCAICQEITTEAKEDHSFDNTCDTTCNNKDCKYTRTITHTPNEDDGDCETAIHCKICDAITTPAKIHSYTNACDTTCNNDGCKHTRVTYHEPLPDDGNCTTPIRCVICQEITTEAKEHSFDNTCDTTCNNKDCKYTRTITHTPNEDDGDCETAIHCKICDAITTPAKSHSFTNACDTDCNNTGCEFTRTTEHRPEDDDDDCTTDILCSICDAVTTKGKDSHTGGTATCTDKAECSVCGTKYGELLEHTFTVPQNDGTHHWNKCKDCVAIDTKVKHTGEDDGDCTTEVKCSCGWVLIVAKAHSFDNACDPDCNNPGCEHTRPTSHTPRTDDGNCLTEIRCIICNVITTEARDAHTGGTATCTAKAKCEVCDTEYGELGMHGETEVKDAKQATCTAEGYTGDTYCKTCGEKLESGTAIAKTAHTYKDGKCTVCNKADPNCDADVPQTGDNRLPGLWITLLVSSAGGVLAALVVKRKKGKANNQ